MTVIIIALLAFLILLGYGANKGRIKNPEHFETDNEEEKL